MPEVRERARRQVGADLLFVHRLDRGTSGVVLFARDVGSHRRMSRLFETRHVGKIYLAAVLGHVEPASGTIDSPIRAFGSGRMGVDARGKAATTDYALKERLARGDLLEVRPHTGRRHQVRVHLYSIGHPVLGDDRYGRDRPVGGVGRLMLHASELTVPTEDGGLLAIAAGPPPDFVGVLDAERHP